MTDKREITGVITEPDLLNLLGVSRTTLDDMRYAGLPFCRLTRNSRVYLVRDVLEFLEGRRVVLNQAGVSVGRANAPLRVPTSGRKSTLGVSTDTNENGAIA